MFKPIHIGLCCLGLLALSACSAKLNPKEFDTGNTATAPGLQGIQPVAVKAKLVGSSVKTLPVPGVEVELNEDEFTEVLASRLTNTLKKANVTVNPNSSRSIEIQVVKIALQPDRTFYCVIDFNRTLGNGDLYGFQSRSKDLNYETACDEALNSAVNDLLNDQNTIRYLKGE